MQVKKKNSPSSPHATFLPKLNVQVAFKSLSPHQCSCQTLEAIITKALSALCEMACAQGSYRVISSFITHQIHPHAFLAEAAAQKQVFLLDKEYQDHRRNKSFCLLNISCPFSFKANCSKLITRTVPFKQHEVCGYLKGTVQIGGL